ncbi:MAG: high-potential iron-sulfur protein [Bdellovibrionales bacterium]
MKNIFERNLSRRSLLKSILGFSALGLVGQLPQLKAHAAGDMKLVDDKKDQMAKSMNYHHSKKDVPKNLQTKRMDVEFKEQSCKNCMFYIDPKGKVGKDNVGTCQLIQSGKVKEAGWCSTWAKKA